MPSDLNASSLSALMLAALLLCARGAPIADAPTDGGAEDSSGEQEEAEPTAVLNSFKQAITVTELARNYVAAEFQSALSDDDPGHQDIRSLAARCPASNFSKEACLRRLAEGLQTYLVLLRYVEREYPINNTVTHTKVLTETLIKMMKNEMKNPQRVKPLTSSQEKKLLSSIDIYKDAYNRKMTAISILRELYFFLVDGKRAIFKRETTKAGLVKRDASPVYLYYQLLKDERGDNLV